MRTAISDTTIYNTLEKHWTYREFRSIQLPLIKRFFNGQSSLGIMPTGTGKSLCYQLPSLLLDHPLIVICPLISLMLDQCYQARKHGVRAVTIHSGMRIAEQEEAYRLLYSDQCDLFFMSPERIQSEVFIDTLRQCQISGIVIDEAHCISQWGYDFRPSYLQIKNLIEALPSIPVLALTATATVGTCEDIMTVLGVQDMQLIRKDRRRDNLHLNIQRVDDKNQFIIDHIDRESSSIIYVRSRKHVELLCQYLNRKKIIAIPYHAGLHKGEREKNQALWFSDHAQCIVATNAFGMGVNKNNVRQIFHYGIPPTIEEYMQEIGRAGRDGEVAHCYLLYNQKDISISRFKERNMIDWGRFIAGISKKYQDVRKQEKLLSLKEKLGIKTDDIKKSEVLNQISFRGLKPIFDSIQQPKMQNFTTMIGFISTVTCRYEFLSQYFDRHHAVICQSCDNCKREETKVLQPLSKDHIIQLVSVNATIKLTDVIRLFSSYKKSDILSVISELYEEEQIRVTDDFISRTDPS